jgi:glycosyltransferase involved in cell wall biosynthesis
MAERIRVLWLTKGLGPGGAEKLLCLFAKTGDRSRFDYQAAYLLPWKDQLVAELRSLGVAVHCLNGDKEWDLRWAGRLRQLLVRERIDLVHTQTPYVSGVARLVTRTLVDGRRPVSVSTEHVPWSSYVRAARWLNAVTFRLDAAHIAVSPETEHSIPSLFRARVHTLFQGIDVATVRHQASSRSEARAEMGINSDEVCVGIVANFRAQKAYPDLLRAARVLLEQGMPVRFVSIGQGPLEEEIRALHHRLKLGDRFLLMGYRADATRLMSGFDILALTSLWEGTPLVIMEALALGLPVVATNVGGVPEVVTDGVNGLLVPPHRPDLVADALTKLILDPDLRARLGHASTGRADRFDISRAIEKTEAIYEQSVESRISSRR